MLTLNTVKDKEESSISRNISPLKNSHLSDLVTMFPSICSSCIYRRKENPERDRE